MPYRLAVDEDIDKGLRRIFLEEIAKVRRALDDEDKTSEQRIFKARKRLKRARSVVRLLKAPLGAGPQERLAETLRSVGKALSPARDADMLVKSATLLAQAAGTGHDAAFDKLVARLETRAATLHSKVPADLEWSRAAMRAAEADAQRVPLNFSAETVFDTAFERIYGRGRAYRQIAVQTGKAEAFHDWRKYVKQRWHLSLLVRDLRDEQFSETIARLAHLGRLLGSDHDYAVLEDLCQAEPTIAGPVKVRRLVRDTIREQQHQIRKQVLALAGDLYDERLETALKSFQSAYQNGSGANSDDPDSQPIRKIPEASAAE